MFNPFYTGRWTGVGRAQLAQRLFCFLFFFQLAATRNEGPHT